MISRSLAVRPVTISQLAEGGRLKLEGARLADFLGVLRHEHSVFAYVLLGLLLGVF
jgi:hypothetical protein